jgi:signal peptidase II
MNRIFKMSVLVATIIILDQITKAVVQQKFFLGESIPVIKGLFSFTYIKNPGAAFGMLATSPDYIRTPLFFALPVIACGWLMYLVWTTRNTSFLHCLSYSLIFAGAVGNLIDRFSMNYVVDFLDFYIGKNHFPAFNIADSVITIAAILLIFDFLFLQKKKTDSATSTV